MKAMRHKCKDKPSAVLVRECTTSSFHKGGWVIDYNESEYVGSDRKVWAKTVITVPIKFCPWCGEKLEGADDGEK